MLCYFLFILFNLRFILLDTKYMWFKCAYDIAYNIYYSMSFTCVLSSSGWLKPTLLNFFIVNKEMISVLFYVISYFLMMERSMKRCNWFCIAEDISEYLYVIRQGLNAYSDNKFLMHRYKLHIFLFLQWRIDNHFYSNKNPPAIFGTCTWKKTQEM